MYEVLYETPDTFDWKYLELFFGRRDATPSQLSIVNVSQWSMILSVKHCTELALMSLRVFKHNGTCQTLQVKEYEENLRTLQILCYWVDPNILKREEE